MIYNVSLPVRHVWGFGSRAVGWGAAGAAGPGGLCLCKLARIYALAALCSM
jgi:hypothetical protein